MNDAEMAISALNGNRLANSPLSTQTSSDKNGGKQSLARRYTH